MSTATPVSTPRRQRLFVDAISWREYERLGRMFQDRPLRITYDRGMLEIMTKSAKHERWSELLAYLVFALADETRTEIASAGSMTFKRELKRRGLEPDKCFWIQNEAAVRGKMEFTLDDAPPPDLVLEVEISRSLINRMGIYAKFGFPEIWRCNSRKLKVCQLIDGKYVESDTSLAFPFLRPAQLITFLNDRATLGETALVREFRDWVRQQIALGWPA